MPAKVTSDLYKKDFFSFEQYINITRWVSYYHQISRSLAIVEQAERGEVCVVGLGDGIVPAVLRSYGVKVTTFDYSTDLSPDLVGDVRAIESHFRANAFDLIICCQVLEHLEYSSFSVVLKQFARISPHVLLSLPCRDVKLFSGLLKIYKMTIRPKITVSRFWEHNFSHSQHYWEIGVKGFSPNTIRADLEKHFIVEDEFTDSLNMYHKFYVLNRRNSVN